MIRLGLILIALNCAVGAEGDAPDNKLTQTRSALEKWIETRQVISKTKADWHSDKETIEQTIALFQRELQSLDEQSAKLGAQNSQAGKEHAEADALKSASLVSLEQTRRFAAAFEKNLARIIPQLPVPLRDILKPLLNRLPIDADKTEMPVTERIQAIVGILNEMDKFNSALTVFSEKRTNSRNEEVAVQTVYLGLGAAYFVNDAGDFAGTGKPGLTGWDWSINSNLAPAVKEVILIYRNERPARFVNLPATVE